MSSLQYELMQTTSGLSDDSLQIVLEFVRKFIAPYDSKTAPNTSKAAPKAKVCKIGSRKGVQFIADGHDIDECNDEIEAMFGEMDA